MRIIFLSKFNFETSFKEDFSYLVQYNQIYAYELSKIPKFSISIKKAHFHPIFPLKFNLNFEAHLNNFVYVQARNILNYSGKIPISSLVDNKYITFQYFYVVSLKRSFHGQNLPRHKLLRNYSLSSWAKLQRTSSTSHCIFLMRGCAINLPIFIENSLKTWVIRIFWDSMKIHKLSDWGSLSY